MPLRAPLRLPLARPRLVDHAIAGGSLALFLLLFTALGASPGFVPLLAIPLALGGWRYGFLRGLLFAFVVVWGGIIFLHFGGVASSPSAAVVAFGIAGGAGYFRDVRDASHAALERMSAAERRWKGLIKSAPLVVAEIDRAGMVTFFHRPREGGTPPEEVEGLPAESLVTTDERPRFREMFAAVVHEGHEANADFQAAFGGRCIRAWSTTAGPIRDARGEARGMLLLARDVTDQRKTAEAIRQAEKLSSLGTLVAGVAHEINNPLTFIRGNVELSELDVSDILEGRTPPDELRPTLERFRASQVTVTNGLDRIAHIVQSLKCVARSSRLVRQPEDPNILVDSVVTVAATRMGEQVMLKVEPRATNRIMADAGEITQVLLNLVLNAIEELDPKSDAQLVVRTLDEGAHVVFEVADNGRGIPEDIQASIFSPFVTSKPHGTGLGLSISRHIAKDHGGDLAFTTGPHGTTMRLNIPAYAPPPAPTQTAGALSAT